MRHFIAAISVLSFILMCEPASPLEITPFQTVNQSPLVQIFGLPAAERAVILAPGKLEGVAAVDIANHFAMDKLDSEEITLDGESYRLTTALRYGFADGIEGGVDIPFLGHGSGIFDGFIEGWHNFLGLPQGRQDAPSNRLLYQYKKNGQHRLTMNDSNFGMGDLHLSGGIRLYDNAGAERRAVALRASLKLPTGESRHLIGSGSTDFALWLTASDDHRLSWGRITLFGAAGGMVLTDGDILPEQQNNLAAFGTFGVGWSPAEWIALKTQLSGHTPFFRGSELRELSSSGLQLVIGGTLAFSPNTSLDIGVSEDIAVNTSPDVALHLALRRLF